MWRRNAGLGQICVLWRGRSVRSGFHLSLNFLYDSVHISLSLGFRVSYLQSRNKAIWSSPSHCCDLHTWFAACLVFAFGLRCPAGWGWGQRWFPGLQALTKLSMNHSSLQCPCVTQKEILGLGLWVWGSGRGKWNGEVALFTSLPSIGNYLGKFSRMYTGGRANSIVERIN